MKKWIPGVLFLLLSVTVFLVTFVEPIRTTSVISFNVLSGINGEIKLDIPDYVISNTQARIRLTIDFEGEHFTNNPIYLSGRYETGIEEINPRGSFEVAINPVETFVFDWKIKPGKKAIYPGSIWLFLISDGKEELLLSREVPVHSITLFGLDTRTVRILAGGFGIFGCVLILLQRRKREVH